VIKKQTLALVIPLVLTAGISGCEQNSSEQVLQRAVAIESADECHLCGMIISRFPGPKGELISRGQHVVKKFCSTRDLFAFVLEPENTPHVAQVFVHDMAVVPWESPNTEEFVDAKLAYYVVDHSQKGAMGPTLASFKFKADAVQFSRQFGGRVIRFEQITLELLRDLVIRS
jgi:copper chaperone NosL